MNGREQDVTIAKIIGVEVPESGTAPTPEIPDYSTPAGSWLIIDYIRENPTSKFARYFLDVLDGVLDPCGYKARCFVLEDFITILTPLMIRDAAYTVAVFLTEEDFRELTW